MPVATHSSREDLGRAFGQLVAFPGGRRPERPPSNLPLELSSFIGRVKEMAQAVRLLGSITRDSICSTKLLSVSKRSKDLESKKWGTPRRTRTRAPVL